MVAPTLLVLAAGKGSRYGGVKVIEPVGPQGETLLEYSLYDARKAGFARIVFVIRRDIDHAIKETLGARIMRNFAVEYVYQDLVRIPWGYQVPLERSRPWGTTHAVLCAAGKIREPFAVMNVDDFYGAQSYATLAHYLHAGAAECAMVGYVLRNTLPDTGPVARGVCQLDDHGFLQGIVEYKNVERQNGHAVCIDAAGLEMKLTGNEVVSMNLWGFHPEVFEPMADQFEDFLKVHGDDLETECYLPNTVHNLITEGRMRVKVLASVDPWFGVTYRDDHARAIQTIRHMIEAGYYPRHLWA
ncbi:MAG TPA: NTP transferase domain-containing protein [Terracidiphilus sp.]|nr:NTP transferase domain-containing protein [Terracidiphilus sp.]